MPQFNHTQIDGDFSAASRRYAAHARLQARIGAALIARTAPLLPASPLLLDVGCGPGNVTQQWNARAIALDAAFGMCVEAREKKLPAVRASAESLPICTDSLDAVASNLMLQWVERSDLFFAEAARVLKPGGILAITSFVEGTLGELRDAFAAEGEAGRISEFARPATLSAGVKKAGLLMLEDSCTVWPEEYADVAALCASLRAIGATNKNTARPRGMMTPRKFSAIATQYPKHGDNIIASWHVHTIIARKHP